MLVSQPKHVVGTQKNHINEVILFELSKQILKIDYIHKLTFKILFIQTCGEDIIVVCFFS